MTKSAPKQAPKSNTKTRSVKGKQNQPQVKSTAHKQKSIRQKSKPTEHKPKSVQAADKKGLHERNLHRDGYDFELLIGASPELKIFVRPNPYGNLSIDFSDPLAVKALNLALLKAHYHIESWDIPQGFLCPPIPGRVDYIHYLADLLAGNIQQQISLEPSEESQSEQNVPVLKNSSTKAATKANSIPTGYKIKALDIGTGANGIYPLLGIQSYGWQFTASDVDTVSIANVESVIEANLCLQGKFKTRLQTDHQKVFHGIIKADDRFDVTLCNPPFHSSLAEAGEGSQRKLKNLAANRTAKGHQSEAAKVKGANVDLNFGGQKAELWCEGGEKQFLFNMIRESADFKTQCLWFTSLVSKKENLKPSYVALEKAGAVSIKTIDMAQGNKLTRVLAWSYLTPKQQALWAKYRG
ncbi:23S rRNA m(6)A-1618 methyltransferase [Shewanella psychrophila]|uniref:Ribosomal RNA large subunit methyltransferase F n=1 Tax=Shewanella psychrophila TaxID=225848 RepID=A0A1S6HYS3_9GAMM|nr:23S rRNA (adenine(1618)-N(6))-methyltransferase RlmF [Shewanella psychrophila]AQS40594.1 23S rRNA m(6)A-1618 methyltransferase [Shewanella psychrophila]